MRTALALVAALLLLGGCAFQAARTDSGSAYLWTVMDLRVGWKESRAGEVAVEASKEKVSEDGANLMRAVARDAARIALICAGVIPAPLQAGERCPMPDLPVEAGVSEGNP